MVQRKNFNLVSKSVPTRERSSLYKDMVEEFLESGEASVLVDQTNRKPVTLVQGLRKAIETGEMDAVKVCLLYTSDAADDLLCVDLGGRRIIKKKTNSKTHTLHP